MILVDTSIWIDHLRKGDAALIDILEGGLVLMHPFVQGELACGNLAARRQVLSHLDRLPLAHVATHAEALTFIERRGLMGRGVGFVDVHLLASAILSGHARLWTRDRRLHEVAAELELAYNSPV